MAEEQHNQKRVDAVADWQPKPYAQRSSQSVHFGDFIERGIGRLLIGGLTGSIIGWPLDRLRSAYTNQIHGGYSSFRWWGGILGSMVGGWSGWRRAEAMGLQADQVLRDYRNLPGLLVTNDELLADNKLLARMVEHQAQTLAASPDSKTESHQNDGRILDVSTRNHLK